MGYELCMINNINMTYQDDIAISTRSVVDMMQIQVAQWLQVATSPDSSAGGENINYVIPAFRVQAPSAAAWASHCAKPFCAYGIYTYITYIYIHIY